MGVWPCLSRNEEVNIEGWPASFVLIAVPAPTPMPVEPPLGLLPLVVAGIKEVKR